MVLYIKRQKKRENIKNVIYFIADHFKEDKTLKGIIEQKIDNSSEIKKQDIM